MAMARVSGDPDLARQTLLDHLTRIDPNMGMIVTMRTVARLEGFFLNIAFWIALILGSLALLLTVSGLFSVLCTSSSSAPRRLACEWHWARRRRRSRS